MEKKNSLFYLLLSAIIAIFNIYIYIYIYIHCWINFNIFLYIGVNISLGLSILGNGMNGIKTFLMKIGVENNAVAI